MGITNTLYPTKGSKTEAGKMICRPAQCSICSHSMKWERLQNRYLHLMADHKKAMEKARASKEAESDIIHAKLAKMPKMMSNFIRPECSISSSKDVNKLRDPTKIESQEMLETACYQSVYTNFYRGGGTIMVTIFN